jgi:hypothetical protein
MIGPPRRNGRPPDTRLDDAELYGLSRRKIWRMMGSKRWIAMPELGKRVIANDLLRTRRGIKPLP